MLQIGRQEFPGSSVVRTRQMAWVQSMVGELRSHGVAKKKVYIKVEPKLLAFAVWKLTLALQC